jgi:hypothetical protein
LMASGSRVVRARCSSSVSYASYSACRLCVRLAKAR